MWQAQTGCLVALTFDFDAESLWLSFGLDTPSALSRGAYGANEGVPRILRLLDRLDLPATFFITGDSADRHPDRVMDEEVPVPPKDQPGVRDQLHAAVSRSDRPVLRRKTSSRLGRCNSIVFSWRPAESSTRRMAGIATSPRST